MISEQRVVPTARPTELTGIVGRQRFEDPPGDITSAEALARWTRFRTAYARASRLEEPGEFPLQVDFELISSCNLRCAFCTHGLEKVERRLLGFDRFARALAEGEEHGLVSIKLNYINEPLLLPDWARYVREAKRRGVLNIYFATNGVLLNVKNREELVETRVSKVLVSLDAITAETFRVMRRSDAFELIRRNVLDLLELRERRGVAWPLVRVNFLKTALNVAEAEPFYDFWKDRADAIGFQDQVGLPGQDSEILASGPYVDHENFGCSFPSKLLVVDSYGSILPCCTFSGRSLPLGSIDSITLREAWASISIRALRSEHRARTWASNPICRFCLKGASV
jgi:Predicted Fe-S oxidoreductases